VLPSDAGETWGLVVNEAMACGRPAIVSDQVGCAPDLVLNGNTGFIFPFGDRTALANALQQLIEDPALLARLGTRAASHVAIAGVDRAVAATIDALQAVLSRPAFA